MKRRFVLPTFLLISMSACIYLFYPKNQKILFDSHVIDAIHTPKINAFFEKADGYKYAQNYPKAKALFEEFLSKSNRVEDSMYAYNQLIYCVLAMNEDSLAAQYFKEFDTHFRHIENRDPSVLGDYFYNKGIFSYRIFHPKEAEFYLKSALELYKENYPPNHIKIAQCMTQLGLFLYEFGKRVEDIVDYLPTAYSIFQTDELMAKNSAFCELGYALVSLLKREYVKGAANCDNAIRLSQNAPYFDTVLVARCLSLKGNMLKKRSQGIRDTAQQKWLLNQATQLFVEAIDLLKPTKNCRLQQGYRDLIIHLYQINDLPSFQLRMNELETILTTQTDRFGQPERLKGYTSFIGKNYKESLKWYRQFWTHFEKDTVRNSVILSETFHGLGLMYDYFGQFDSAKYFIKKDIVRGTNLENQDLTLAQITSLSYDKYRDFKFVSFGVLSGVYWHHFQEKKDIKALESCFNIAKLCDDILFIGVATVDEDAILHFQLEHTDSLYARAIDAAYLLYKKTNNAYYVDMGFRFNERMKSFLLYRNTKDTSITTDPKLMDSIRILNAELNRIKWEQNHVHNQSEKLVIVQHKLDELYQILEQKYPQYFRSKFVQNIAQIADIQSFIGKNKTMVSYSLAGKFAYRFVIKQNKIDFEKMDSTSHINREIGQFLTYLKDKDSLKATTYVAAGQRLCEKLLGNLPPQYNELSEHIIIPDRLLNLLPFEALVDPSWQPNKTIDFSSIPYLVQRLNINYAPSWKVYKDNCRVPIPTNPTVGFYTYALESFELPAVEDEIKAVNAAFPQRTTFFKGNDCSKTSFLNQRKAFDIVHISLHASSDLSEKNNNKLFFSPNRKDSLYGFDLLNNYLQTPLVVLSACQTAVGKIETGEGAFSLSRSFLQSGCNHVVASLWNIDDNATARQLVFFYQNIAQGDTVSKALQKAKIQYLRQSNKFKTRPYFWAGLIALD